MLMKPNVIRMRQGRPMYHFIALCACMFDVSSTAIESETESKSTSTLCVY